MRLAVIMPVYNEAALLRRSAERVLRTPPPSDVDGEPIDRTLLIIDDGSSDGTTEIARELGGWDGVEVIVREANGGKGAALRDGLSRVRAAGFDLAVIQDADLEYDPADHARVLAPLIDGRADAVIGTRFAGETHRVLYYWHSVGNRVLTTLSNMLSNLNLTDMECGTKAFGRAVLSRLDVVEPRFGVEPEFVARLSRMRVEDDGATRALRIYEVPVSYAGRTYAEGKKIGWRDGVEAIRCILRHNWFPVRAAASSIERAPEAETDKETETGPGQASAG